MPSFAEPRDWRVLQIKSQIRVQPGCTTGFLWQIRSPSKDPDHLETEMQRRAPQRANDLGVSLAEYFRRPVHVILLVPKQQPA